KAAAHLARLDDFANAHKGQPVAFVGASVGLCNILHRSSVKRLMEIEIFDGDGLKAGRYLPGVDRPIRLTGDKALEGHAHIFVTPLNFFDEIVASLRERAGLQTASIVQLFA